MIHKLIHWPYWMEIVRLLTFAMASVILIFAVLAYTKEQNNQNNLLHKIQQNTATIKGLTGQLKSETDSIHQQASCIFLFFSQPQSSRNSTAVTYPPQCVVNSSSGGATGSTKSD